MTAGGAVRRRVDRVRATGQAGVTLLEVVVSMSVLSMVMAVFTTGFLAMYRSANRTEAMSVAQSQITTAFQRLDKEIRYAAAISEPGSIGGAFFVEYLTTTSGTAKCSQLRLDTSDPTNSKLQLRAWTQGTQPPQWGTVPVLASNLRPDQPFLPPADTIPTGFQRLRLTLEYSGGSGSTASTARTEVTFAALNSEAEMAGAYQTICTEGRSAP